MAKVLFSSLSPLLFPLVFVDVQFPAEALGSFALFEVVQTADSNISSGLFLL